MGKRKEADAQGGWLLVKERHQINRHFCLPIILAQTATWPVLATPKYLPHVDDARAGGLLDVGIGLWKDHQDQDLARVLHVSKARSDGHSNLDCL